MGRLPKAKVDKIRELHEAGYLQSEIAEKAKVSRSTVGKYIKELEQAPPGPPLPVLEVIVENLFELLVNLVVATYLSPDDYPQIIDATALKLLTEIAQADREFGKRVLDNSYLSYLKNDVLDLSVSNDKLDAETAKQRRMWVEFFKQYYPEELAKLM